MQQGYPPQYPGQQAYADPAGYNMPQNAGMMGYPPQGMPQMQAYPPAPMMQAQQPYPPAPMGMGGFGGAPMMSNPPMMGGDQTMGGAPMLGEDHYAYAQQYGLTREETDGALEAYRDLNSGDRGLLSSFGMGSAQSLLGKVFGSAGNEQMIAALVSVLGSAFASGRMPSIKDFISLMGQYKMNSLGQSLTGKVLGNGGGHSGQYAGLGPMGTGYGQTGGFGGMMGGLMGDDHHHEGKHKKKDKGKHKKK